MEEGGELEAIGRKLWSVAYLLKNYAEGREGKGGDIG